MSGLTGVEAREKLEEFGPNEIFRRKKVRFLETFRHEVTEPMILLLIFVGVVYSVWGALADAITIFSIILVLVFVEVYNEYRAKKAINSLEQMAAPRARVLRDEKEAEVPSMEIVPGDLLILTTGTKVAADAKIARSIGLQLDESPLTGESLPVEKKGGDEIYAGTTVLSGEGEAEVYNTGSKTKFGQIARTLEEVKPPRTPMQMEMRSLSGKLVYVAVFFSALIPIIGIIRGQDMRLMILTGLSLAFATIPEELPIVITMVLSLGSYNLARKSFLVKKLEAAETLGGATVIVTDKTGTITEGKMTIASVYPEDVIEKAAMAISLYSISPMEEAIKERYGARDEPEIYREKGLENGRRIKSIIRKSTKGYELFVSGAPEEVLKISEKKPEGIDDVIKEETSEGRRTLGVGYKELGKGAEDLSFDEIEKNLEFAGLIGFEDKPRENVRETIEQLKNAKVRVIMVTGDHPLTAEHIAGEVGIPRDDVIEGEGMDKMSDEELRERVKSVSVFARASPQHKHRIVEVLQQNGEIVAVTGDGINDSIALKSADVGIAMGIRGTDVAREAADVVLADDNFITIAHALFEGRKFFDNLRKGIGYYLSVKVALISIFLLPVLAGIPTPFAPVQIILLELFMDLAASAGFVSEPAERNIYERPPRNPEEKVLSRRVVADILVKGILLFSGVTAVYLISRHSGIGFMESQTLAFSSWIFGHVFLAFFSRSEKEPLLSVGLLSNRIIDLWGILAFLFLAAGIYVEPLRNSLDLAFIAPQFLALVFFSMLVLMSVLELRKVTGMGAGKW
ncbi:MAG: cation-transporting P-type ATPase [Candidatus Thermoplasmatota archaeon]|nr:cation-transporting P-type ATPase [Candidatus Thermoplasmatota archaeon]